MTFTRTLIFSDGACSGNPGPGGFGTIVVTPNGLVKELGGRDPDTTNNRMELMGAIRGIAIAMDLDPAEIEVYTDSTYVIRGITQWIWGWKKRGWKTAEGEEVANRDLWEKLYSLVYRPGSAKIFWKYVRGHRGTPGNERVDEIAVAFTQGKRPTLYDGPLLRYGVAIHDLPDDTSLPEPKPIQEKKAKAYSYLSVVNGSPARHATWPECEQRVKGRSGAKFKKAMSAQDEVTILGEWGFAPDDLK